LVFFFSLVATDIAYCPPNLNVSTDRFGGQTEGKMANNLPNRRIAAAVAASKATFAPD
jgi:hypothetical protein